MSRRKQSTIEDLIDIASKFPWWGGLMIALISFILLNRFAKIEIQKAKDMSHLGSHMAKQMFIAFAKLGQIIIPFVFILGALILAIKQKKRKKIFTSVEKYIAPKGYFHPQKNLNPINNMSWQEFEMLISEFFRRQHFSVLENLSGGPDGGVDLRIKKDGKTFFVQCKHWKKFKVGVNIVREQLGIMASEGANGSIIVTSGLFTDDAINFARQHNIMLIDGNELKEVIAKAKKTVPINETHTQSLPLCPVCSAPMVERIAKKGNNAGTKFWGCKNFPKCKGTLSKQKG